MNKPLSFPINRFEGINPLTIEGLRIHAIDPTTHREYLLTEEASVYPETPPVPLTEVLLGKLSIAQFDGREVNVYQLPQDYLTMSALLNDSSSSGSTRALSFTKGIFSEIGHALRRIHDSSFLVPAELSYEDIIIERDVSNFRILPPVEFVENPDTTALRGVGEVLLDELLDNSGNHARRVFVKRAFNGFWNGIGQ